MLNKKNINFDYKKNFCDYLKSTADQDGNPRFYFIGDKIKKLFFY